MIHCLLAAILGIILQGLAAEIETCFTKHISKSQFKAYDYLGSHVQKFHVSIELLLILINLGLTIYLNTLHRSFL